MRSFWLNSGIFLYYFRSPHGSPGLREASQGFFPNSDLGGQITNELGEFLPHIYSDYSVLGVGQLRAFSHGCDFSSWKHGFASGMFYSFYSF